MIGESVMDRKWKILVTEKVGEAGLDIFRNAPDVELDVEIGLAEEELIAKLHTDAQRHDDGRKEDRGRQKP